MKIIPINNSVDTVSLSKLATAPDSKSFWTTRNKVAHVVFFTLFCFGAGIFLAHLPKTGTFFRSCCENEMLRQCPEIAERGHGYCKFSCASWCP